MDKFKAFIFSIIVIVGVYLGVDNYLNKKLRVVDNSIRHEYSYDKSFSTKTIMNNITENTVVFFGSSELNPENVPNEHPLGLLNYKDINFMLVGGGYFQSLTHTINLGAITSEDKFKKNKFVLVLSPQWFDRDGLEKEAFLPRYSEEAMIDFLKNKDIPEEDKRYVISRVEELTQDNSVFQKNLNFFKKAYLKNKVLYKIYSEFYLKLISLKNMYKYLKVHNSDISKDPKEAFKFDVFDELSKAEKDGEENSTNNIYGIHNEYYDKYIKDRLGELKSSEIEKDYLESPEYEDLKMFIKIAKELNVDVAIVNVPLNGLWIEYTGFKRENIDKFNQKIKEICDIEGVKYIDFSLNIDEKYFLKDIMHLGWKGWVRLIDEVIKFNSK